jgi:hypothetical protein
MIESSMSPPRDNISPMQYAMKLSKAENQNLKNPYYQSLISKRDTK